MPYSATATFFRPVKPSLNTVCSSPQIGSSTACANPLNTFGVPFFSGARPNSSYGYMTVATRCCPRSRRSRAGRTRGRQRDQQRPRSSHCYQRRAAQQQLAQRGSGPRAAGAIHSHARQSPETTTTATAHRRTAAAATTRRTIRSCRFAREIARSGDDLPGGEDAPGHFGAARAKRDAADLAQCAGAPAAITGSMRILAGVFVICTVGACAFDTSGGPSGAPAAAADATLIAPPPDAGVADAAPTPPGPPDACTGKRCDGDHSGGG